MPRQFGTHVIAVAVADTMTDAERATQVIEQAVLIWTTDTKKLWVGDGSTAGGILVGPGAEGTGTGDTLTPVDPYTLPTDGYSASFKLPWDLITGDEKYFTATRNGLSVVRTENQPTTIDEWIIQGDEITFGAVPKTSDVIVVSGWTR